MRLIMTAAALAALAVLAGPVRAQNAPANLRPTRDVAVTYRLTEASEPPQEMRMAWSVAAGKLRVDPPGGGEWMLLDQRAGSAVVVMDAQRTTMTIPSSAAAAMEQIVPANAQFARKGTAQVAGTSCTEWEVTAPQGTGTICITNDGVMLRSVAGPQDEIFRMEATSVQYGPPPALFAVPQGYRAQ
jgi:hypothetical protein